MSKVLVINPDKCTACRACELACSMKHTGEFNPARSRIKDYNFLEEAIYIPMTCTQCDEAWCARICPAGAIKKDESLGAWRVDHARCVGCRMCELACPFGSIIVDSMEKKAAKCDLCDGQPECVLFCAPGALEYREMEDAVSFKHKAYAEKLKTSHREVKV